MSREFFYFPGFTRKAISFSIDDGNIPLDRKFLNMYCTCLTKKATEVVRRLILRGVERLKSLFKGNKSRSEIVATFLAVLEMCKTGSVRLEDDISGENPQVRLIKTDSEEGGTSNGTN